MSTYQQFPESGQPAPTPSTEGTGDNNYAPAYQNTPYDQPVSQDYSNYPPPAAPAQEEEFSFTSIRVILRFVEVLLALICFAVMASIPHYADSLTPVPEGQQLVMIGASAFVYVILLIMSDLLRVKSRYYANLDLWEYAFDFLFTVLAFCGSLSLAVRCNTKSGDVPLCKVIDSSEISSTNFNKAGASAAFGFLLSFVFAASTFISFKRVSSSRT